MSNSDVFGAPMFLTGIRPVSPFGAATRDSSSAAASAGPARRMLQILRRLFAFTSRDQRIRNTVLELSKLDDRTLRDIGVERSAIMGVAEKIAGRPGYSTTGRVHR